MNLQSNYDDMIRLQEYFLGYKTDSLEKVDKTKKELETAADLNQPIRHLCTDIAEVLNREINRLEKNIDNAIIKVD